MEDIVLKVREIMTDSLYKEAELTTEELELGGAPPGAILVEGLMRSFGFHPERLESHRAEVKSILLAMPPAFHKEKTGMSFLNLCADKHGNQWGEHRDMEELCCLAIGLGMGTFPMPHELWDTLPGGVPYVSFDVEGIRERDEDPNC